MEARLLGLDWFLWAALREVTLGFAIRSELDPLPRKSVVEPCSEWFAVAT